MLNEKLCRAIVIVGLAVSIFWFYSPSWAMKSNKQVGAKLLPIERVQALPKWAESYDLEYFKLIGKGSGDSKSLSAWNTDKTVQFQIIDDGKKAKLFVKKQNHLWELLSNQSDLGFGFGSIWSFDGKSFAIEKINMINIDNEVEGEIFVIRVDTKERPEVISVAREVWGSHLAWSHSGDKLVFSDHDEIYIYSLSDSKIIKIASGYGSQQGYPAISGNFSWSKDDNQIAFSYFARPQIDEPEYYIISNVSSVFKDK